MIMPIKHVCGPVWHQENRMNVYKWHILFFSVAPEIKGDVICVCVCRRFYPPQITPKMFLLEWSRKEKLEQPFYETVRKCREASVFIRC